MTDSTDRSGAMDSTSGAMDGTVLVRPHVSMGGHSRLILDRRPPEETTCEPHSGCQLTAGRWSHSDTC